MPIQVDSDIPVFSEYEFHYLGHRVIGVIQWINMDNHDIEFRTLQN